MTAPPDPKFLLRGNMDENVHSLLYRFDSNVEHLCAGDDKGTVHIWDLKTNRIIHQLSSAGSSPCFNLHTTNESDLIIQRRHGIVDVYNVNESSWLLNKSIDYKYCSFCRSQLLVEKKALLIPLNSSVGILSLNTFNVDLMLDLSKLSCNDKLGTVMAIKPVTEELILAVYEGGRLLLWDTRKNNNVLSSLVVEEYPTTVDFDVSLMQGIIGSASDGLEIFNVLPDHTLFKKRVKRIDYVSGTSIVRIRPDKKIVAVGFWNGHVILFSWKKLRPLVILKEHKDTVHDIVYPSRRLETYDTEYLMAAAGKDGYISLWDIYK